jgi:replicative DNA helicase
MALQDNINYVFYFDLDNSPTTLKKRGIDKIEQRWGERFQYHSPLQKKNGRVVKKEDIWHVITKLKTRNLKNILIVFDSAKNFLKAGADRDKNKDVSPLMDFFRILRDLGATVILLHHTNKPNKELGELTYAGSSAWEEDSSNAFLLSYNDYKKAFIFKPFKNRIGEIEETAFIYKEENHYLKKVDVEWAKETQIDETIRNEIIDFIKTSYQKPIYSQIMKHMQELGFTNKDKVNGIVQAGKGKYWKTTKVPEKNNRDIYELINKEARISQISPFNSDKSYFRGTKGELTMQISHQL